MQEELGGAGVYSMDERLLWAGVAADQRHDVLPEIWSGHNVADFVDPNIDEKLRALERDEDAAAAEAERLVRTLSRHPVQRLWGAEATVSTLSVTKTQPAEPGVYNAVYLSGRAASCVKRCGKNAYTLNRHCPRESHTLHFVQDSQTLHAAGFVV